MRRASHDWGMPDTLQNNHGQNLQSAHRATTRQDETVPGAILPLPEDVVAQIKSSTAITSLSGVVLELLKNSLDAASTKVEITVDFKRGGCVVEDNGLGIPPAEFREGGHLGKMYCTSRQHDVTYGTSGTFLASLAALSLLTVTSHHHLHRSTNGITFHRSTVISRQNPSPIQHALNYREHGTRVTVRNLFGNMPVRVKQRALVLEKSEHDRLWDALRREVVALLVAWDDPVQVRIRDAETCKALTLTGHTDSGQATSDGGSLRSLRSILTQAALVPPEDWQSWVPITASTRSISIEGAISLTPAPTKRVQFLSLGFRPLSPLFGHHALYDEINRLFSLSTFGTVDDELDPDEAELERRKHDKRYKHDRYTIGQLRGARKGIDRWPMFSLKIVLKDAPNGAPPEDSLFERTNCLQTVLNILTTVVTQWLAAQHFRPHKRQVRHPQKRTESPSSPNTQAEGDLRKFFQVNHSEGSQSPRTSPVDSRRKRAKLSRTASPMRPSGASKGQRLIFDDWSRIKSGKSGFFDSIVGGSKVATSKDRSERIPVCPQNHSPFNLEPIPAGSLDSQIAAIKKVPQPTPRAPSGDNSSSEYGSVPDFDDLTDDTMTWVDPATKEAFLVNARTGCVLPSQPIRTTSAPGPSTKTPRTLKDFNMSLRLPQKERPSTTGAPKGEWLSSFLAEWKNPVFAPAEAPIPQVSLHGPSVDIAELPKPGHHRCSHGNMSATFEDSSVSNGATKLSREDLKTARVIAQVDRKFILAEMGASSATPNSMSQRRRQLVIIDQHAADERCRIEALLAELCSPPSSDDPIYRSQLGFTSRVKTSILESPLLFQVTTAEAELLRTYAAHFAAWGILYNIKASKDERAPREPRRQQQQQQQQHTIAVHTLPPGIAERCRTTPHLAIDLLRSEAWRLAEDRGAASSSSLLPLQVPSFVPTDRDRDREPPWLRALGAIPPGLLDLLNSRACRSAIMFNDALSVAACADLLRRLAACTFPFLCAHGRVAVVPVVEMAGLGAEGDGDGGGSGVDGDVDGDVDGEEGFAGAWRRWRGGAGAGDDAGGKR